MTIHIVRSFSLSSALGGLFVASLAHAQPAPPQPATTWAFAGKTGIGASYEAYVDGAYRDGGPTGAVSKVWFSVADGVLTETMYGLIHEAQIKQMRIAVQTPTGLAVEGEDTIARTEYLHTDAAGRPLSLAYKITTRDKQGRFEIEKRIFTDPDRQSLFLRITIRALKGPVTPYLLLEPHIANTGSGDEGRAAPDALTANDQGVFLTLTPTRAFERAGVGRLGVTDGLTALRAGRADWTHATSGATRGALMLTGQWPTVAAGQATYDVAIGFGRSAKASADEAAGSLRTGYGEILARFNGEGARVGWEDYLASLGELPRLRAMSTDGGKLLQASALMLKVQEDRTYAGALIASLSNPWGETASAEEPATGYKAVWPRDLYQCAMALAALGDRQTPLAAFRYLSHVQVGPATPKNRGVGGWFMQKSHVDGTPEWKSVQLDQTAMPIMLGWKLWRMGWLSTAEIAASYKSMLKPAADFLVDGGDVDLDWNQTKITPPFSQQERWEEQPGYSPSTMAALVTGLVSAAEIAAAFGDAAAAARYRAAADSDAAQMEKLTFTTKGAFGDGHYYLRLNPTSDPDDHSLMEGRNGKPSIVKDQVMDAGFLELVRYGVRRADDPHVLATLAKLDDTSRESLLRIRYDFTFPGQDGRFPGWRRYGGDAYGEDVDVGSNYGAGGVMSPGQRGRVWPILTGERGHYELALSLLNDGAAKTSVARIRNQYVRAMELFANEGLLLPEQVWDGVGAPNFPGEKPGQGTNSATPLAWSHAEYVKLLRSLSDRAVWDSYAPVRQRYAPGMSKP